MPADEICRTVTTSIILKVISKKNKFESIKLIKRPMRFLFPECSFQYYTISLSFLDDPDPHSINLCFGTTLAFKREKKTQRIMINDKMCSKISI